MGDESFSDPATAEVMNRNFVSVKVDREERPDVDAVYMEAVQATTGRGGWPMSVFATPEGLPFFAGTYFPDRARHGMPSFRQVLDAVAEAWETRRSELVDQARALAVAVANRLEPPEQQIVIDQASPRAGELNDQAIERLTSIYDPRDGGFGSAPKFPQPLLLDLLLRDHVSRQARHLSTDEKLPSTQGTRSLEIVERTLEAMASGGIYDHLGGGFARYSVDQHWDVPHFEKMLYDQALISRVYLHAWQLSGDPRWLQVLDETIAYVLAELRDPAGGLYSAEDADSEGEEGRYYVWSLDEVTAAVGPELAPETAAWYGVTAEGNFEGRRTVLHRARRGDLIRTPSIETARSKLLAARADRVRPGLDDKVITEWNAMMCSTLLEAAAATGRGDWAVAAEQTVGFLLRSLRRPDGRVLRSWCRGQADLLGYAADYAWLVDCCTRLGELSGDPRWLAEAVTVARQLVSLFGDDQRGGLFTTGDDAPPLVVRPRDLYDGVTPAAGSVAAVALSRLGALVGDDELAGSAARIVAAVGATLAAAPSAFPELLLAVSLLENGPVEVVVTGDRPDLLQAARERFMPWAVIAWRSHHLEASVSGEPASDLGGALFEGRTEGLAYVCHRGACLSPVDNLEDLIDSLEAAARRL
jgi:uncharacterized protein YyaL (SSP411 family)